MDRHAVSLADLPLQLAADLFVNLGLTRTPFHLAQNCRGRVSLMVAREWEGKAREPALYLGWREDGEQYPFRIFSRGEIGGVHERPGTGGTPLLRVYLEDGGIEDVLGAARIRRFLDWYRWRGSDGRQRPTGWAAPFELTVDFPGRKKPLHKAFSTPQEAKRFRQGLAEGVGWSDCYVRGEGGNVPAWLGAGRPEAA